MPAYEEPPVLPGGSFYKNFEILKKNWENLTRFITAGCYSDFIKGGIVKFIPGVWAGKAPADER